MGSHSNVSLGMPGVAQSNEYFYLIPNGFNAATNIQVTIDGIAGPAMTSGSGLCPIPKTPWQDSFNFSWNNDGGQPSAVVTIAAATATGTTDAERTALKKDFDTFVTQLRNLEATSEAAGSCLIPGGAAIIANRVALAMPLRLNETLGYYYNFNCNDRWIDLIPGMRLQVQAAPYSYIDLAGRGAGKSNSYVASGQYEIDVTIGPHGNIAFSGWSGAIQPPKVSHIYVQNDNAQSGQSNDITYEIQVLGLADLAAQDTLKRHWRLVWPANLSGATTPQGDPLIYENATLIGCNSPLSLEKAASSFKSASTQELWYPQAPTVDTVPIYAFFTGRATIIPQVSVTVNGAQRWLAAGTTLRQLSMQFGLPSLLQMAPANAMPNSFALQIKRYAAAGSYELQPITFSANNQSTFDHAGNTMWDLPLMCGDNINF